MIDDTFLYDPLLANPSSEESGAVTIFDEPRPFDFIIDRLVNARPQEPPRRIVMTEGSGKSTMHLLNYDVANRALLNASSVMHRPSARVSPGSPSRRDQIVSILVRRESLELLMRLGAAQSPGATHTVLMDFAAETSDSLHTFADMVSEDLIGLRDGQLTLTPLAERILERLASE